jgi:DNA-directed RNA polymerase sigma subunit (sigma70/sigma32)
MSNRRFETRDRLIYDEYTNGQGHTLRSLGDKYDLSYERIRGIVAAERLRRQHAERQTTLGGFITRIVDILNA